MKITKKLVMLIGLPRSGKTTLRNLFLLGHREYVTICADDLRYSIYGQRFYSGGEPIVWMVRGYMLESLFQNNTNILIDETNTTIKRREPIITQAKKYGYEVIGVYVNTDISLCRLRADDIILPIVDKMHDQFEVPEISEGFDAIHEVLGIDYSGFLAGINV